MTEPTLESLAKRVEELNGLARRVEELERKLAARETVYPPGVVPPSRDWRTVIGMMEDNEFTPRWIAEMGASREAEREAARRGEFDDEQ